MENLSCDIVYQDNANIKTKYLSKDKGIFFKNKYYSKVTTEIPFFDLYDGMIYNVYVYRILVLYFYSFNNKFF